MVILLPNTDVIPQICFVLYFSPDGNKAIYSSWSGYSKCMYIFYPDQTSLVEHYWRNFSKHRGPFIGLYHNTAGYIFVDTSLPYCPTPPPHSLTKMCWNPCAFAGENVFSGKRCCDVALKSSVLTTRLKRQMICVVVLVV